jgi:hypothetical protein
MLLILAQASIVKPTSVKTKLVLRLALYAPVPAGDQWLPAGHGGMGDE